MIAKRQWRLHASILLSLLMSSLETQEGHPLSSLLPLNAIRRSDLYDEAPHSDDDPVYRTNGFYSLDNSHGLSQPPLLLEAFPTENQNTAGISGRKFHGSIPFIPGEEETQDGDGNRNQDDRHPETKIHFSFRQTDHGLPLLYGTKVSDTLRSRYKYSMLKQRNHVLDSIVDFLLRDKYTGNDNGETTGSMMKRSSYFLLRPSSKRINTIAIRDEGQVHPVFLGFGQETTGAALNTLARLLADEERMHRLYPIHTTKESIRFIG